MPACRASSAFDSPRSLRRSSTCPHDGVMAERQPESASACRHPGPSAALACKPFSHHARPAARNLADRGQHPDYRRRPATAPAPSPGGAGSAPVPGLQHAHAHGPRMALVRGGPGPGASPAAPRQAVIEVSRSAAVNMRFGRVVAVRRSQPWPGRPRGRRSQPSSAACAAGRRTTARPARRGAACRSTNVPWPGRPAARPRCVRVPGTPPARCCGSMASDSRSRP